MKYCKDCNHFERYPSKDLGYVSTKSLCNRVYTTNEDPVIGIYIIKGTFTAAYERNDSWRCGPDAKYFERKNDYSSSK